MKHSYARYIPMTILAALLAACGTKESDSKPLVEEGSSSPAAPADSMPGMSMSKDEPTRGQPHSAMGTITAVDAPAGTITIAHEAVTSAGWPAMTMTFKLADPKQAAEVHANEKVHFTFTVDEKGESTVTTITATDHAM